MEKEENYSASLSGNFTPLDYTNHHAHHLMKTQIGEPTSSTDQQMVVDYNNSNMNMVHGIHHPHHNEPPQAMNMMMSFADVMQFADFGPKLGLINKTSSEEENIDDDDPVYFLKFPVLNHYQQHHNHDHDDAHHHGHHMRESELGNSNGKGGLLLHDDVDVVDDDDDDDVMIRGGSGGDGGGSAAVQLRILGENLEKNGDSSVAETNNNGNSKSKRKRPRSVKTSEEVESQRMTHIAVERNRRKQMNEHLRVLRSLMPGSYVQRGDQASIIGGAIEFVRELEQLLQCLESQKRRRLYGGDGGGGGRPPMAAEDSSSSSLPNIHQQPQPPPSFLIPPLGGQVVLPNDHQMKLVELETAGQQQLREETAESKSCLADIEVKLLGFDAMIKILSRRRPGQLIKTIAALEDLQLNILHTNITTIEQTVLYSFNVKVAGEARVTAEDIANSVQQIFSFIHADNTNII